MKEKIKDTITTEIELGGGSVLPKRDDVPQIYKWKLDDIYLDEASWEADFKMIKDRLGEISSFMGKSWGSAQRLCLNVSN